jgi:hypothetical protein
VSAITSKIGRQRPSQLPLQLRIHMLFGDDQV